MDNEQTFETLQKCLETFSKFALALLTIGDCNGGKQRPKNRGYAFTDAECYTDVYKETYFAFRSIFQHGYEILRKYLEEKTVPEETYLKITLSKLIAFLLVDGNYLFALSYCIFFAYFCFRGRAVHADPRCRLISIETVKLTSSQPCWSLRASPFQQTLGVNMYLRVRVYTCFREQRWPSG